MKSSIVSSIAAIGLFWVVQTPAITLTEWGTSASASSADCTIVLCSKTDFLLFNPIIDGPSDGGLNQTSAALLDYVNPEGRGTVSASIALQGGLSIPILKARAESVDANGWVSALAMGIQGYQFTGSDGTTISLDSALTGSVTNTSGSDVTGLSVGVWLIMGDPAVVFPTATSLSDLVLQIAVMPIVDSFTWEDLSTGVVDRGTTTTDTGDQLEITLNNGDEFYVLAALTAAADGTGAVADAFSTFEMGFNTTELVPAVVPAPDTTVVAATLPTSRSVQLGSTATAFATVINTGSATATDCGIAALTSVSADFAYQTTDAANALVGTANTPVDIAAGGSQSYVFAFTPTAPIPPADVQLTFDCANTEPAAVTVGLNTLLLVADSNPVPDIVALGATLSGDGIVNLSGTGVFSVATVNVGVAGTLTVSADTGNVSLPVSVAMCETEPATGVCINPTVPTSAPVTTSIDAGATPTFAFFVTSTASVPFDPANNRVFVRFEDTGGVTRGATSVAVRTL
jgi:hypothetical protein